MKKPLNKFALALWMVAAAFAVADFFWLYSTAQQLKALAPRDIDPLPPQQILMTVQSVLTVGGLLASMGVLIELVDQIRWHLVHKTQ